jgi:RimJ/RimL family protein N-acetyltransferase
VIETLRLVLRPPVPGDAAPLLEAFADPDVMRYIGLGETGTLQDAIAQVERMTRAWELDGFGRFVVVRAEDGLVIGRVGLLAWDPLTWTSGVRREIGDRAETELGWTLIRSAWGRGYAAEAASAVRDWALAVVRPARLISLIHPENLRSKRVAEKLGERFDREVFTRRGVPAELWALPSTDRTSS